MAKRRKAPSGAQTIGGILAGFDGQVFRTTPPPHELVQKGDRLPAIPTGDGRMLIIELPEDRAALDRDRRGLRRADDPAQGAGPGRSPGGLTGS